MAVKPEIIDLPDGDIIQVATAVRNGFLIPLLGDSKYYQTWRATGEDEPTEEEFEEEKVLIYTRIDRVAGEDVLVGGAVIGDIKDIDVYVRSEGADGKIRLDI